MTLKHLKLTLLQAVCRHKKVKIISFDKATKVPKEAACVGCAAHLEVDKTIVKWKKIKDDTHIEWVKKEHELIEKKKSKLSASERQKVEQAYEIYFGKKK